MSRTGARGLAFWMVRSIIDVVSLLVPRQLRRDWRSEWFGELVALLNAREFRHFQVVRFVAGCLPDAFTVRQLAFESGLECRSTVLDSPLLCLATLAGIFTLACGTLVTVRGCPAFEVWRVVGHLGLTGLGLAGSFAISLHPWASRSRSGYEENSQVGLYAWRRLVFSVLKVVFVLGAAGTGATVLLAPLSDGSIQMHGYLVPYLVAVRWCAFDDARRCPVCGWRTCHPVRIGTSVSGFLNWVGTERICRHGHGLLYESESHCIATPRWWLSLDPSWEVLFQSSQDRR